MDNSKKSVIPTQHFFRHSVILPHQVGQLVQVNLIKPDVANRISMYGVVIGVYDDRISVYAENGHVLLYLLRAENHHLAKVNILSIEDLRHNNLPVMAKRKWFGGYKFPKKNISNYYD